MSLEIFDSKGRCYSEEQIAAIQQHLEGGHLDTEAVDQIADLLDHNAWGSTTAAEIAEIVRSTGRCVRDINEET